MVACLLMATAATDINNDNNITATIATDGDDEGQRAGRMHEQTAMVIASLRPKPACSKLIYIAFARCCRAGPVARAT